MTTKRMTNDKVIYNISTLKTNITKENVIIYFRLKKIDEARNYLLEEIKHNDLMIEKHKKVCKTLNYLQHFQVTVSAVSSCV